MSIQLFNEYHTLESLVFEINEYDADDRARLAGYYAFDAALDNHADAHEVLKQHRQHDEFSTHLDALRDAGCKFNCDEAMFWAVKHTHDAINTDD